MIDAFQLTSKNWSHRTTEKLKCSYRFRGVEKRSVNLSHCFRMKHRKVHEDDNIIEKPVPQAPDIRAIIKFAIPAIGIWLCGPLLSLIDTAGAVGILSGTAQLAAFEILGKLWPPEPDPDIGGSGKKQNAFILHSGLNYLRWHNRKWDAAAC